MKGAGGRIPDLIEKVSKAIIADVAVGVPYEFAADNAGISESTMTKWMARGRRANPGDERYVRFFRDILKARSKAVSLRVKRIGKAAAKGNWQADAWFLERRHSEHFASNRHELKEIRAQLEALTQAVKSGQLKIGDTSGKKTAQDNSKADVSGKSVSDTDDAE